MSYTGISILTPDGGELVYTAASPGTEAMISAPVTPGRYIPRVHHYVGALSSYTVTAQPA